MRWHNPSYLYLLFAIPFLVIFFELILRSSRLKILKLIHMKNFAKLVQGFSESRRRSKFYLILMSFVLIVFALARPQYGLKEEIVNTNSLDVMVVLDFSLSMNTKDVGLSRLDKAKHEIKNLTEKLDGDKIGVVGFANSAQVLLPMTSDYAYLNSYLEDINTNFFNSQGTATDDAINVAIDTLEKNDEILKSQGNVLAKDAENKAKRAKVILLISDGEDQYGDFASLKIAKARNIPVFTIGIGSSSGGPIPLDNSPDGSFKKDKQGNVVISKANFENLKKISDSTGGIAYESTLIENEIVSFINSIKSMNRDKQGEAVIRIYEDRFQYFLLPAVLFFIISIFVSDRKKVLALSFLLVPIIVAGIAFMIPGVTHALGPEYVEKNNEAVKEYNSQNFKDATSNFAKAQAQKPNDGNIKFNIGASKFKEGNTKDAISSFESLRENPNFKAESLYNLGNSYAKENSADSKTKALDSYFQALKEVKQNPNKKQLESLIKKNIELLNKKQKQDKQDKQQDQKNQDKQDKQDQKKEDKLDDKKNEDKQNQDKQNQDKQNQDKQKQSQNENKKQDEKQQQFNSKKLSKEDAEKILDKLNENEKQQNREQLMNKLNKEKGKPNNNDKDW